ncbi:MAG: hypothetical protein H8E20_12310 [Verrucomicrobia bacterium]|nr:hypothetical protein [Verrucomicrobiota bacterium]
MKASLQGTGDAPPLFKGQIVVLFDIPIIGLFKAVGFEHDTLHHTQNNNLLNPKQQPPSAWPSAVLR